MRALLFIIALGLISCTKQSSTSEGSRIAKSISYLEVSGKKIQVLLRSLPDSSRHNQPMDIYLTADSQDLTTAERLECMNKQIQEFSEALANPAFKSKMSDISIIRFTFSVIMPNWARQKCVSSVTVKANLASIFTCVIEDAQFSKLTSCGIVTKDMIVSYFNGLPSDVEKAKDQFNKLKGNLDVLSKNLQ